MRKLRSFQIDHTMIKNKKKQSSHIFLKNGPWLGMRYCTNASFRDLGNTHFTFHKSTHQHHNWCANGQWSNKWLECSGEREHIGHMLFSTTMMPVWASFCLVFIFSSNAVWTNTLVLWGTSPRPSPHASDGIIMRNWAQFVKFECEWFCGKLAWGVEGPNY